MKKAASSIILAFGFCLVSAQSITSFLPMSGPIGTTVNIFGTGFNSTPSNNVVFFGAAQATVTGAIPTMLTVTVPLGATYKPISVTVGGSVALSTLPFLVTFPGGDNVINSCTFDPRVEFSTSSVSPGGVVLADFDGDGKEDIAITVGSTDVVGVFRNTSTIGVTSFDPRVNFSTGDFPDGLAVGDLDGDGKLDVAVANNNSSNVSILRNISTPGTIAFAAKVDVGASLTNGRRVAIGDIDGDGKLDLAIPNNFTMVSVLKNQSTIGAIAFAPKVDFTVHGSSTAPVDVSVTDLDGDNKPDLAVLLAFTDNRISVLRNTSVTGAIDASSFAPFVQFATGSVPLDLDVGDLDGDLKPDLIATNLSSNSVSLLRNTSTTGVLDASSFAPRIDYNTFASPNSVAVDDFDGDGKPDLAIGRQTSTLDLTLLKNFSSSGTISFSSATSFPSGPVAGGSHFVAAGDIDNDGKADAVLTHLKFSVFLNSTVTTSPTVDSYTPTLGPVGTTVTITGTNYSTIPSRNIVRFNGVAATVTASTTTEITTTVPLNATPGPITVQVGCNPTNIATGPGIFTVNGDCVTTIERNALIQLFNTTNGASDWLNKTNWLSADEDTWHGVTVTGCYVTAIDLGENNLTGFLPIQLGDLTNLTMLHLKENQITGTIPSSVGNLTNLAILELGTNKLTSLPDFSSSLLDKPNLVFNVNGNLLDFASLEPNMVFDQFSYSPQDLIYPGDIIPFLPGQTLTIPFTALGTANSYQWYKDGTPVGGPSPTGDFVKPGAVVGDAGQYVVEITNALVPGLTLSSDPFTVMVDLCDGQPRLAGTLDVSFDPDIGSPTPGTAVGVQSNGKIIASLGTTLGIVRFEPDGTIDGSFAANNYQVSPKQLIVQPDDKILLIDGSDHLLRLNEDGTNDGPFNEDFADEFLAIALQPDGKILIAGYQESPVYLIRLDPDGDNDPTFSAPENLDPNVIRVQSDGFILIGGSLDGGITRLDEFGNIDGSFAGYLNGEVNDIAIQPDGKIIVVGSFLEGPYRGVIRLNSDGTVDNTFNALGITGIETGKSPTSVLLEAGGGIVISGYFDAGGGSLRKNLVRLLPDGSVDCSFDPAGSTNMPILDMVHDADEKILIAGPFVSYDGTTRNGLARVFNIGGCLPISERNALIALYNSTNGVGWTDKTNWLSADESTWFGVTITGCNVTNIVLPNNNLVGALPTEIGDLTELTELKLSYNHLTGSLPSTITSLTNLQYLFVDNNVTLSGPLPGTIGNMAALKELVTQGNTFNGPIPAALASCSQLTNLFLEGNQHTGTIPTFLGSLSNLYSINLGANQFSGTIPTELGNLANLNYLNLASNQLTGSIPTSLGSLSVLALFDAHDNQLTGSIPTQLGNLSALTSLQLWHNQLSGNLPTELGNLAVLQYMNLSENLLTGSIPISFGNLGALTFLEVYTNQLTGTIPTQLGNATSIVFMRLSDNQLTGSIPNTFENMTGLYLLDLDRNQLTGPIPPELGNITTLKFLNLHINQLSGPIPPEIGNLLLLEDLNIYTNQLTGTLPIELAQCVNLKRFGASGNQFSGTLPKEYASWTGLTDLGINNNNLTGAVPIEYLAWTNIIRLYFSANQLDAIPAFTAGTILEFNVDNNFFEFGDLEPNISVTGYSYIPQADLPGGTFNVNAGSPLTIPFATSGTANQYQWFKNGVLIPGATSATFSIASTTVADAGSYTVAVTNTIVTGLTINSLPFIVSITPVINITLNIFDQIVCDGNIGTFVVAATGATNITYQWQYSPDSIVPFIDLTNTGGYSGTTTPTLSINTAGTFGAGRYRCRINGDLAVEVLSFDEGLFINALPTAPGTTGNSGCAFTSISLSATGGVTGQYRWYTVSTGGTPIVSEFNDTYLTPALSTTTTYYATINNGTCESTRTAVVATVLALPTSPTVLGSLGCAPSASLTLNAAGGSPGEYRWYTIASGGSPLVGETNSSYVTSALSATTTFYVSINNTICESLRVPVIAEIRSCTPIITVASAQTPAGSSLSINIALLVTIISDPIDISSIKVISQPTSGAIATIVAGVLEINYEGISFAGTDHVTIEACDLAGHCAQQEITIEVVGEITVYNAISPNGDGKNDVFIIQYIDALPETKQNKVTILNRWGTVVFEVADYDNSSNVFKGLSNSGSELPSGTYFYTIEFSSGAPKRTGFISLRR